MKVNIFHLRKMKADVGTCLAAFFIVILIIAFYINLLPLKVFVDENNFFLIFLSSTYEKIDRLGIGLYRACLRDYFAY